MAAMQNALLTGSEEQDDAGFSIRKYLVLHGRAGLEMAVLGPKTGVLCELVRHAACKVLLRSVAVSCV